jgi:hypothetical protein
MNTRLLIRALCRYRKSKQEALKINIKHGRTDLSDKNIRQILEIDTSIDELENQLIEERLN